MILPLLLYNEWFLIIYSGLLFECNAQKLGLFLPPLLDFKMPFQAKTWLLAFVSSHIVTPHNGPCWKPSLDEVEEALTNVSFVLMNSSSKLCLPGFFAPRPLLVSSLKAVQKPSQKPPPHYPPREHVGKGCTPILFVGCPATIWLQMTASHTSLQKLRGLARPMLWWVWRFLLCLLLY